MNFWNSASGVVRIRLISADMEAALRKCNAEGVNITNLRGKDALTAEFCIQRGDLPRLNRIVQSRGDRIELMDKIGIYWGFRRLIQRPVLVFGVILLVFLTLYLPTRVLILEVEGNRSIPANEILEAAENCGITFWANTRQVRSEKMKNALLQQIPNLQWAGINTDGSVVVISVREKTMPDWQDYRYPISSMVAAKDGYVTDITVTSGQAACKPGQTVTKGQLLISAYTDCGLHIRAQKAEGEVFADTKHAMTVISPMEYEVKGSKQQMSTTFGIIVGKKHIKFSKESGILGAECDRIKSVRYITLPGGFQLPFGIITDTVISYDTDHIQRSEDDAAAAITDFAKQHLLSGMIAGRVTEQDETIVFQDGVCLLNGNYRCNEMICRPRTEEIMQQYEQNNGTNTERRTN